MKIIHYSESSDQTQIKLGFDYGSIWQLHNIQRVCRSNSKTEYYMKLWKTNVFKGKTKYLSTSQAVESKYNFLSS